MKKIIIALLYVFVTLSAFSQSGNISGKVISKRDNQSVIGATVFLKSPGFKKGVSANVNGNFKFESIPYGEYYLEITSLGFRKITKQIVLNKAEVNLSTFKMKEISIKLKAYNVEAKIPLAVQKGDTTEYNSQAYKVNKDATTEDLVEKMPGISSRNGEMTAHGEVIKRVLVDGKPFFGDDPKAALKNIPASAVEKIQVINEKSDESKATGFDDGNTIKTINIVTKKEFRNGKFGNVYAGIGTENKNFTDNRYKAGGNYNIFNGTKRISFVGQFNNVNQQNFSGEDLFGITAGKRRKRGYERGGSLQANSSSFSVPQQDGIARTNAMGVNFSNSWGKKTDFIGSYFYNNSKTDALENVLQKYYSSENISQEYRERDSSFTENANQRISLKFKHKFSAKDEIFVRTNMSLQDNYGISNLLGNTDIGTSAINELKSNYTTNLLGYSMDAKIYYNHKFAKKGRSAFVQFRNKLNGNDGTSFLQSEGQDYINVDFDTLNQQAKLLSMNNSLAVKVRYTEPIGKKGGLMFDYDVAKTVNNSTNKTFNAPFFTEDYLNLDTAFSSEFETNALNHNFAFGYRYFSKKIFTFLRVKYQTTDFRTATVFPSQENTKKTYHAILPFAMFKYSFTRSKNFFIMVHSSTSNPSINQVTNLLDNRNPLQLRIGNNNLTQSTSSRIRLRYNTSNVKKATTFSANLSANFSEDRISSTLDFYGKDTTINKVFLEQGTLLNSYENLKGYQNLSGFVSYGLPLKAIRCNLNLEVRYDFSKIPSLINGVSNMTNSSKYEGGVVVSSNISENFDFIVSLRPSYSVLTSETNISQNANYFSNDSKVKLTWTFKKDYVLRTQAVYQTNTGFSDGLNVSFLMWNASISKKIFKNKQGEIRLSIFDIMRQNNSLNVTTTNLYIQEATSNVLQRYFMLRFSYNIKSFKGNSK